VREIVIKRYIRTKQSAAAQLG